MNYFFKNVAIGALVVVPIVLFLVFLLVEFGINGLLLGALFLFLFGMCALIGLLITTISE